MGNLHHCLSNGIPDQIKVFLPSGLLQQAFALHEEATIAVVWRRLYFFRDRGLTSFVLFMSCCGPNLYERNFDCEVDRLLGCVKLFRGITLFFILPCPPCLYPCSFDHPNENHPFLKGLDTCRFENDLSPDFEVSRISRAGVGRRLRMCFSC